MLSNTNTIDLVSQEPDATYRLITVVETGEWALENAEYLLQEKMNSYLIYALDGQLKQDYPDAELPVLKSVCNLCLTRH